MTLDREWRWRITDELGTPLSEGTVMGPEPLGVDDADSMALAVLGRTSAGGLVATAWPVGTPDLVGMAVRREFDDEWVAA